MQSWASAVVPPVRQAVTGSVHEPHADVEHALAESDALVHALLHMPMAASSGTLVSGAASGVPVAASIGVVPVSLLLPVSGTAAASMLCVAASPVCSLPASVEALT